MIDAKPIPGSDKVVASFSPGHGRPEHAGQITVVGPAPGSRRSARRLRTVTQNVDYRDPWAFSEQAFLAARRQQIVLVDGRRQIDPIYELPDADRRAGFECHEPRPLAARPRENVIARRPPIGTARPASSWWSTSTKAATWRGSSRGEIKKLLVLEIAAQADQFHRRHGAAQLRRHLHAGTDPGHRARRARRLGLRGSARPAAACSSWPWTRTTCRSSGCRASPSVMPGETRSCIGCHEHRGRRPAMPLGRLPRPCRRRPSRIEPIADAPEVFDFPRDVQPVLDRHCVGCHSRRQAGREARAFRRPWADVLAELLHDHRPAASWPTAATAWATTRRAPSAAPPAGS